MADTTILKAERLDLFYGDHQALKSIDMEIPANQITALIGPSGCGKSTFLRTINRMNDLIENVTIRGSLTGEQREALTRAIETDFAIPAQRQIYESGGTT